MSKQMKWNDEGDWSYSYNSKYAIVSEGDRVLLIGPWHHDDDGRSYKHFPTRDEAKAFAINHYKTQTAEGQLEEARKEIKRLKANG